MKKIFYQISSGIFGGTILGIIFFPILIGYSEKHGKCFAFADSLFNSAGYESCGAAGASIGIILGSFLGIFLIGRIKTIHYLKYFVILILAAVFLPFIYAFLSSLPKSLTDTDAFIVLPITLIFVFFSTILSAIIVLMANWLKNKFKK